jgi:pentatricopeptide repeat protein
MHRCLLSHALPARARCVPNFLALNRPSPPRWRTTLPWRCYNTAVEESRADETLHFSGPDSQTSGDAPQPTELSSDSLDKQQIEGDALDFILEGYETNPDHTARAKKHKEERVRENFAKYDAHIRYRQADAGLGKTLLKRRITRRKPSSVRRPQIKRPSKLEHTLRTLPRVPALWGRPRYVSVTTMGQFSSGALDRVWNYNYARAQNEFDKSQASGNGKVNRAMPLLDPRAAEWVDLVTQRMANNEDPNLQDIATRHNTGKRNVWTHVALWMLHYDKDCLVEFLLATSGSYSPGLRVADCLQVLAAHYVRSGSSETVEYIAKLNQIFCGLAENPTAKGMAFDGRFIRLVMPYSTTAQLIELHRTIKVGEFRVHANTLMHLTAYFAKHDHFHQALDILLDAHRGGARLQSYAFRSNCSTLLRKSMSLPGGLRVCLRIVDNLAKIGVRLNTRLCNIIILNAVEAGDVKTAHDVYHSLLENNIKPSMHTYALLLKACKLNIDDADALNNTITSAIDGSDLSHSPVVAVEILHCLALHHTRNSGEAAWSTVCQAYAQIFKLEPLLLLGLPIPASTQSLPQSRQLKRVPVQAIGIMLRTYLKIIHDGQGTAVRAQPIYQRYRQLVDSRKEPFASSAMTSHCYNAFLGTFTKNKRTLINAAEVIKDMQSASAASPPKSIAPDVQSWSIFLEGFSTHGQLRLAEQVLTYMRGKGLEPNAVTWNTLLKGYAGEQDMEGLLDTVGRIDENSHPWDEWTYGGLRRFRNSEQLKLAMDKRRKGAAAPLDFTSELKESIGARLSDADAVKYEPPIVA